MAHFTPVYVVDHYDQRFIVVLDDTPLVSFSGRDSMGVESFGDDAALFLAEKLAERRSVDVIKIKSEYDTECLQASEYLSTDDETIVKAALEKHRVKALERKMPQQIINLVQIYQNVGRLIKDLEEYSVDHDFAALQMLIEDDLSEMYWLHLRRIGAIGHKEELPEALWSKFCKNMLELEE